MIILWLLWDLPKDVLQDILEVGGRAPTLPEEDPHINIEVGARGVTVATTSREQQKKGTLLSPVLNANALYSIVSPISVAKVEVNDVTTRALLDAGATTNIMTPAYARKLDLNLDPLKI